MRIRSALFLLLVLPAAAQAAYAPKLAVKIDPATPNQPVSIVSTITQASGETPNKTVKVSFPAGYTTNLSTATICTPEQEAARACPMESQIGTAKATAEVAPLITTDLAGNVFYGGPQPDNTIKIIVFLSGSLAGDQPVIEGFVSIRKEDAGFDTTFDNLPNTLTTNFELAFLGGEKALTKTPAKCGVQPFKAHFTSQKGEESDASFDTTISGCPMVPPSIGGIDFDPASVKPGKKTEMAFSLSEEADLSILVKAKTGKRKQILSANPKGTLGPNTVILKVPSKAKPGKYRVTMVATDSDGMSSTRSATLTVKKPKKHRKAKKHR